MALTKIALLTDRGVVRVAGPDAAKLLQGLITQDMGALDGRAAIYSGLLSPQGKILFDFLVVKAGDGAFRLETARDVTASLVSRLNLYRLRADVVIEDVSPAYTVAAFWGGPVALGDGDTVFADPRLDTLGRRAHVSMPSDWILGESGAVPTPATEYHAHRIALGVPEGGKDFAFGDAFPHEALFDQLGGVSFSKGCFVGQEVVSRMEHRGTAKKRIVPVVAKGPLPPPGTEIRSGEAALGTLGSVAAMRGLALLRLDRVAEVIAAGGEITCGGAAIEVGLPAFATFGITAERPPTAP